MSRRHRVLIAAPPDVVRRLQAALAEEEIDAVGASTPHEAERRLEEPFDLVVVCYVFDETRPYRLVHQARNPRPARPPQSRPVRAATLGDTAGAVDLAALNRS